MRCHVALRACRDVGLASDDTRLSRVAASPLSGFARALRQIRLWLAARGRTAVAGIRRAAPRKTGLIGLSATRDAGHGCDSLIRPVLLASSGWQSRGAIKAGH